MLSDKIDEANALNAVDQENFHRVVGPPWDLWIKSEKKRPRVPMVPPNPHPEDEDSKSNPNPVQTVPPNPHPEDSNINQNPLE